MIFRVELVDGPARAYVCENYGGAFTLPDRGPIGANCLANPRDFLTPVAAYEDREEPSTLYVKWGGELYADRASISRRSMSSPGTATAPYKYDLRRFSPVNSVLFDHPDPSIFTVLTAPSEAPGNTQCRLRHFCRWLVDRPEVRSGHLGIIATLMSEFMGLIYGVYDAPAPRLCSRRRDSCTTKCLPAWSRPPTSFQRPATVDLEPVKLTDTMAFMFETRFPQRLTKYAAGLKQLQDDYIDCWRGLRKHFKPEQQAAVTCPCHDRWHARAGARKLGRLGQGASRFSDPEPAFRRVHAAGYGAPPRGRGHRRRDPGPSAGVQLGLFAGVAGEAAQAASGAALNPLFALGRNARAALRHRIGPSSSMPTARSVPGSRLCVTGFSIAPPIAASNSPAAIGDYTDFFAGIHHATNAGKLFRPDNPLLPTNKRCADRLSRPRLVDHGIRRQGPPSRRSAQTRRRGDSTPFRS